MRAPTIIALAAACLCAAPPAVCQAVRLPRATAPLTLLGFEAPDAAAAWTGMACKVMQAQASEGKSALTIRYPKWTTGDQYLPARIDFSNGRGYPTSDWSHFATARFDMWVDGTVPLEVKLELRDDPDQSGFTKEYVVKPGRVNTLELTMADAAETVDVSRIRTVILYGIRPKRDTNAGLDNFRLLPGSRPPAVAFDLVQPNYRGSVYPDAARVKVAARLSPEETGLNSAALVLTLTARSAKGAATARATLSGGKAIVTLPVASAPAGPLTATARVTDRRSRKVVGVKTWALRKLSASEVRAQAVRIDRRNNFLVGGKPFFPIGWYGNTSLDHLEEIADSPFNTVLPYGANTRSRAYMRRYLDLVQAHGMKMIYCMNDVYPTATYLDRTGWEGVFGNDRIADAVVRAYRNHPAVLAWYLNDERPKELMPRLEGYYRRIRDGDPIHPCFIVIYQMPEVKYFPTTTDVMGVDRYPVPTDPVTVVSREMEVAREAVNGHKPVLAVIQSFGWYQYNAAFPDRGRTPSDADLQAGRAPTFDESRCMTYLALVHGAKGLLYYCYYDMRVLPQYAEMWAGMKRIAGEVKALSPMLLEGVDLPPVRSDPADSGVETRFLDLDGVRYLIAVNGRNAPCRATFTLPYGPAGKVSVMFEGRFAMDLAGNKLTDSFRPYEVHVYDIGARR